jgi:hypothetical protein
MNSTPSGQGRRIGVALLVFAVGFGYVEAAVVSYLRVIGEPVRQRFHPQGAPGDLFPLLTAEQAQAAAPEWRRSLAIEVGREAATMLILAAVALAAARNAGGWAAAFAILFGTWDIAFYVFLRLLLDWPPSLLTWDVLFLIPVPWTGPVVAPVLVSASMIGAGLWHWRREARNHPVELRPRHKFGLAAGAAIVVLSFTLDWRNIASGGTPRPFPWTIFAAGLAAGLLSYIDAARTSRAGRRRAAVS